jgi:hypothetical protein
MSKRGQLPLQTARRNDPRLPPECGGRPFLTALQLVDLFQLESVQVVYSWNREDKGPPRYKVGNRLLYRCEEVLLWFDSRLQDADDAEQMLTFTQTANLPRWPVDKLRRAVRDGTAPPYGVIGRVQRWVKSEVIAWQESQTT